MEREREREKQEREREQQERERQEKQKALQSVNKHFEESLRRAHQKVTFKIPTRYLGFIL